ncbi:MAG: right-handed parallel beta-helix repeat-containing protein [Verrucomicrobia bacterium]|nr:right-handed parallel beta-helix repeat-containing protein [Verrucomicrobiota bacterium]
MSVIRGVYWRIMILPALICFAYSGMAVECYVVPPLSVNVFKTTSPAADGSREAPFYKVSDAVSKLRELKTAETKRIIVRGGEYYNVCLNLDSRDSGLVIEAAEGETPVLYGGQPLTGWKRGDDGLYYAALPEFPEPPADYKAQPRDWEIRMLVVDGVMRPRSRYPVEGRLEHLSEFDVPWMSSTGGGWKRDPTREELTTLRFKEGDIGDWLEPQNAEVTVYHMWDESCVGVESVDLKNRILTLDPATGHPPGAFGVKDYVIWNTRKGLSEPGRWYHDRARNRVVYRPMKGENIEEAKVLVPTRTTIFRVKDSEAQKAHRIVLRGLRFSVTTVPLMAGGFAAARYDGAVSLEDTSDCLLEDIVVADVCGHGINTKGGNSGLRIIDSEIEHCGAGGIYAGGSGTVVSNNYVHHIGISYPSAIGIFRGGRGNVVSHNEIHDTSYSAVNYGGISNVVESNLIYRCMQVLHDGAAIYMFAAKDCVLRGNFARDIIDTGGYGASSYYLDERSTGCVVEHNLSLNVARPIHNHMATNNVIRDNVFFAGGDMKLTFPRSVGFEMENNIIHAGGKIRIENWDAVTNWNDNVLFSETGEIERIGFKDYSAVETIHGPPPNTIIDNPMLSDDITNGLVRFKDNSPLSDLGFVPLDVSSAGRIE